VHGAAALALLQDDVALDHFRRAVALAPREPEYLMDLASALYGALVEDGPAGERARLDEGLVAVRRAKELRPDWLEAQQQEALIVEALEGPEAGLRCLEALRRSRPAEEEDTILRYHLGVLAFCAGRASDALTWLKPLVDRGSDHAEALALAAMCHSSLGQAGRAKSQARRAAALGRPCPLPGTAP
jgi:Flp pilus assembly protein TadD